MLEISIWVASGGSMGSGTGTESMAKYPKLMFHIILPYVGSIIQTLNWKKCMFFKDILEFEC